MNVPWIFSTAILASLPVAGASLAAPVGAGNVASTTFPRPAPDLVPVQFEDAGTQDRMSRLRQNRSIIENELRAPQRSTAEPSQPPQPRASALQPPDQGIASVPQDTPVSPEPEPKPQLTAEAVEQVSCDA